jgi:membrane-associated phospholipid phosphatase
MPFPYAFDPFLAVQHALDRPWLDPIMVAATRLCEGWVVVLLALGWAVAAGRTSRRALRLALPVAIALAIDAALVQALKAALHLPRPLAVLGAGHVHVLLAPLRAGSMPSGHASAAATLAAYLRGRRRREAAVAAPLAVLGGVSRVYVGAHWVLDVLAGWAIGGLVGWIVARLAAEPGLALASLPSTAPADASPP